jgi:MFS family permease
MIPRRALALILCTVSLDALAVGLMIPVLPAILVGFMGGDTADVAEMLGLFTTVWALMQFVFSPVLGVLSDRIGRRPIIPISCLGLGLDYVSWRSRLRRPTVPFAAMLERLPGISFDLAGLVPLLSLAVGWWATRALPADDRRR